MPDVTISEAAERLGISREAVRSRLRRGLIEGHKRADGVWIVTVPDRSAPVVNDQTGPVGDSTLVATLNTVLDSLTQQLAEKDRQIAAAQEQLHEKDTQIRELHVLLQTAQQNEQRLLSAGVIEPDSTLAAEERRRREEAERERDDLRARLDVLSTAPTHANVAPAGVREAPAASARSRPAWFRRIFFGGQ